MNAEFDFANEGGAAQAQQLCHEWEYVCAAYLPVIGEGTIWRYSRTHEPGDADQGWKLHISATVLTANETLKAVAPLLRARGTRFKAPCSLQELQELNSGLNYGYTQIGKFITVYPRSDSEAVSLAKSLHKLTRGMPAPIVPFDRQFKLGSCVHYRYGSFQHLEIANADGSSTLAMRDPRGRLIPDVRDSVDAKPAWISDPFISTTPRRSRVRAKSPLATTYRVFEALTQRGKGGVYKAFDLRHNPPRLCILKEGRSLGELAWDGRDGRWRVRNEEAVLLSLRAEGVAVPRVYDSFEIDGNYYLVAEYVHGETLQSLLNRRRRRFSLPVTLNYGVQLAAILSQMHAAGWAWRDCKPANIIVARNGELRPIDFEGACSVARPDPVPWSTPPFASPDREFSPTSGALNDLYALGVCLYLLIGGQLPQPAYAPINKLRRAVPLRVCRIVSELLDHYPRKRPDAVTVKRELTAACAELNDRRATRRPNA